MHTTEPTNNSKGVRRVVSDIVDLCELQWQLLTVDGQEAKRRAVQAAVVLAIAICIALASLPSVTIGLGWLLHDQIGLSVGLSLLIVGSVALLLALIAGMIGLRILSKAGDSLDETRRELAENIRWIKGAVLHPHSSARNQIRRESFPPDHVDPEKSRFRNDRP